jgi:hypothetical protein
MNRFIGSLAIVTTLSYHNYKIAITHNQLPLSRYETALSGVSYTMNNSQLLTELTITKLQWCIHYCWWNSLLYNDGIPLIVTEACLCRGFIETEIPLLSAYLFPQQYVPLPSSRNTCYSMFLLTHLILSFIVPEVRRPSVIKWELTIFWTPCCWGDDAPPPPQPLSMWFTR